MEMIKKYYVKYEEFFWYGVGGTISFVVDFGLLIVFTELVGLWYLLSATMSTSIAVITNYAWQRNITFKNKDTNIAKQFSKFAFISLIAIGLNIILMYALVDGAGLWYVIAKIIVTIIVLIWNYFGNKYYTFKKEINGQHAEAQDQH